MVYCNLIGQIPKNIFSMGITDHQYIFSRQLFVLDFVFFGQCVIFQSQGTNQYAGGLFNLGLQTI